MKRILFIALVLGLGLILLSACGKEDVKEVKDFVEEKDISADTAKESAKAIVEVGENKVKGSVSEFIYHVVDKSPAIVKDADDIIELNVTNYAGSSCSLVTENVAIDDGIIRVRLDRGSRPDCILSITSPSIECGTATGMYSSNDVGNFDSKFIEILEGLCPGNKKWFPILDEYTGEEIG